MIGRTSDTLTAISGIAAIAAITIAGCLVGFDHTLLKLGIAAIAGLAGFSIRGLIRWQ